MSIFSKVFRKIRSVRWQLQTKITSNSTRKNIIVFESLPDLSDNSKAVLDEMLHRGMNKRYKLVWLLFKSDVAIPSNIPNVYYLPFWDYQAQYFSKVAKAKVCCNSFLEKSSDDQPIFYLSHGTGLKDVRGKYELPHWVDYCVAASPNIEGKHATELNYPREKVYGLGFPRNDILTKANSPIRKALNTNCKKIVVWYPTYRQHYWLKYADIQNPIPLLHNAECAKRLNDAAVSCDTLFVIKPHFVQDTQYIKSMNLSNIRFIDDSFFVEHGISSYEFVGSCDALITDYSSIYFDYTLCDKPIALVWEDVEQYKKSTGLVDDYEFLTKGGEKIYTLDELIAFAERISQGEDLLRDARREIRDYTNIDDRSSQRVVDFIIEKARLTD